MLPTKFINALNSFSKFLTEIEITDATKIGERSRKEILFRFQHYHLEMAETLKPFKDVYDEARDLYRLSINPILQESDIIRRNIDIPRGYHGDYETMEMMYRNGFEGTSARGQLLHKIVVDGRECDSVRNRKQYLESRIIEFVDKCYGPASLCSLAAGPAAELRGLPESTLRKIGKVVLIDQDEEALAYALGKLPNCLQSVCEPIAASVADVVFRKVAACCSPQFDYVYSAGLFDYLDAPTSKLLIRRAIQMLQPSGTLEVGNFSIWPAAFFADMSCGWKLILRSEKEMLALLDRDVSGQTRMVADQAFLSVTAS